MVLKHLYTFPHDLTLASKLDKVMTAVSNLQSYMHISNHHYSALKRADTALFPEQLNIPALVGRLIPFSSLNDWFLVSNKANLLYFPGKTERFILLTGISS